MYSLKFAPEGAVTFGLAGTPGAGKQTFVDFFKPYGFKQFSARHNILLPEVDRLGLQPRDSRTSIGIAANSLRSRYGPAYVAYALYEKAIESGGDAVIESIYNVGEIETIRMAAGMRPFILVWIDADIKDRYDRIRRRQSETDRVSFEEFVVQQEREAYSPDPTKHNLLACRELADIRFMNNGTTFQFEQTLAQAFKGLLAHRPLPVACPARN